ncbi:hypothetical protein [Rahnella inusitata]|uniref:hypothetical protein n=1 Tax=Rahnella inusitata TaxID=58169 RepID=UPI0039BE6749
MTDTTDIAALRPAERVKLGFVTDDNTGGHYVAECEECGQIFPSQTCDGGEQIADSGDYGDCYCPHCGFIDPLECDNANLVWNVQQLKIINLTSQLEAERQRADVAEGELRSEVMKNLLATDCMRKAHRKIAEMEGEQVPVAAGTIEKCSPDVYAKGVSACLVDIPKEKAEVICRGISAASGVAVDWHYVGGRVHIKAMRVTAPQKPVVLLPPAYEKSADFTEYHQGWNACRNYMLAEAKEVGGIVKYGE